MRDARAPDLVLARHAGDVWTRAADPAAFDDGSAPPRLRHVPGKRFAALAAAGDQEFDMFRFTHGPSPRPHSSPLLMRTG
jgi:hypothetical protein